MSSIVIAGDTSGSVTLSAPAISGTTTLTLPSTSGIVVAPVSNGTAGQVLTSAGASAPTWATPSSGGLTLITTLIPSSGVTSVQATNVSSYKSLIATVSGVELNVADYLKFAMSMDNGSTYIGGNIFTNSSTNPVGFIQLYQTDTAFIKSGIILTNNTASAITINIGGTGVVNAIRISTNNSNTFAGTGSIHIYGVK